MSHQRTHISQQSQHGGAPVRIHPRQLLFELCAEFLLFRIEELKLEKVPETLGLRPEDLLGPPWRRFEGGQQRQFQDCLVYEVMDDRVAVITGHRMTGRFDAEHGVAALVVPDHQPHANHRPGKLLHVAQAFRPEIAGEANIAIAGPAHQPQTFPLQFAQGQRARSRSQQNHAADRRQRDGGHAVGLHGHFESDLGQRQAVVGVGRLLQHHGIAKIKVHAPHRPAQAGKVADEPLQRLRRLDPADLFTGVFFDIAHEIVAYRDRYHVNVAGIRGVGCFEHVLQQPVARRHQLTGSRAGTLESPGHRKPLFHQVADVVPQHDLVQRLVLETAPNENAPGTAHQLTEAGKSHVRAGEDVQHRKIVFEHFRCQRDAVEVGLVREQQHGRARGNDFAHPFQVLVATDDVLVVTQ